MTDLSQRACTTARLNPSEFPYKATSIKLTERFNAFTPQGTPILEAGSIWQLELPEIGSRDKFGHHIYSLRETAHKPERPYLVLTNREHNEGTGLVCVAPLTTFGGRYFPPPLLQGLCVELKSNRNRSDLEPCEGYRLGFVNLTDVFTCSTERFLSYIHTITQAELRSCRLVLADILGNANASTAQRLFPCFDTSKILNK